METAGLKRYCPVLYAKVNNKINMPVKYFQSYIFLIPVFVRQILHTWNI